MDFLTAFVIVGVIASLSSLVVVLSFGYLTYVHRILRIRTPHLLLFFFLLLGFFFTPFLHSIFELVSVVYSFDDPFTYFIMAALNMLGTVFYLAASVTGLKLAREMLNPLDELSTITRAAMGVGVPEVSIKESKAKHFRSADYSIDQILQANKKLIAQKEELSYFTHTMSHDLRNLLSSISMQAMLAQTDSNTQIPNKILELTNKINSILSQSLSLADAGLLIDKKNEVNLQQLVLAVAEAVVPRRIRLGLGDLPNVQGDENKIFQIFKNLLENAVVHGEPTEIRILSVQSHEGLSLLISNNGKQISEDQQEKIRARKYTFGQKGGLGLVLVAKLVEAHGWSFELKDEPETTFAIMIPS